MKIKHICEGSSIRSFTEQNLSRLGIDTAERGSFFSPNKERKKRIYSEKPTRRAHCLLATERQLSQN